MDPVLGTRLVFLAATALFIWDELYGILFLLSGFILLNRNFAYLHVAFHQIPIYIPEYCLGLWIVRAALSRGRSSVQAWRDLPKAFTRSWILFAGFGFVSLLRGLASYPFLRVIRDSAMVYYSLIMVLVATSNVTLPRLRRAVSILGAVMLLRICICLWLIFGFKQHLSDNFEPVLGQPAAGAMSVSLALLIGLALCKLDLNNVSKKSSAILTGLLVLGDPVRSAWTGLWAGSLFLVAYFKPVMSWRAMGWKLAQLLFFISLMPLGIIYVLASKPVSTSGRVHYVVLEPEKTPSLPKPKPSSAHTAPVARPVQKPLPVNPTDAELKEHLAETKEAVVDVKIPALPPLKKYDYDFSLWGRFCRKFLSFFQGASSANVNTRFLMWRDALSEIFSVGIFSPHLTREGLRKYQLPETILSAPEPIRVRPTRESGLPDDYIELPLSHETSRHFRPSFPRLQVFLGFPFGKLYLPPEVIFGVISVGRYDPHNSLIAITYRLGLLGLAAFIGLFVCAFRQVWHASKRPTDERWLYTGMAGAGSGLVYFLVHSLTDNTLENAFKGIWFWVLLGLVFLLPRIIGPSVER